MTALQGGVTQLKEKERYQRSQVEAGAGNRSKELGPQQLESMKEVLLKFLLVLLLLLQVLQSDSKSIADIVQRVTEVKKELGL